ncbi:autotransporter-associated beta strand repeat-containing protein [Cerasicoccus arenae]|uniref:Uncharacterized protein n=1 Tax=Cerasicoccus arenae TaxID=424488 RepID=A0A8J3DF28_9BACT|nr:autotransporter-associated beta strand repeat-containing protein [Cerasicoccus arenae]MBK1856675.1 autotransporter-associated beta strand repeat-containing protein [Cerasicoccus arenae]GHB98840.1 hypothetical protein GCM10007047_13570 [Cerasicoccus arenae]
MLPVVVSLVALSATVSAQLVYTESFRYDSAPGWEFQTGAAGTSPPARLTALATPDAADPEFGAPQIDINGNGWLRLATTTGNQSNAIALDTAIPSVSNTIRVGFDFAFWKPGTDPADGITVFMWDAGDAFAPGATGGSLGYAQQTGIDGLAGAYVGVGLDVYGNYSNPTEGRVGGPGFLPNEVAVRDSGSGTTGYGYLEGTGDGTNPSLTDTFGPGFSMDFINSPTRPDQDAGDYRHFEMELSSSNELTVWMQNGYDGSLTELFQTTLTGARPDQLRIGFSGSTGGSVEVYEIRNLQVSATGGANSFYWDNEDGNELWGTGVNWDQDTVPSTYSHVIFSDAFPDTKVAQTVNINGGNRTINSATFSGTSSYTLSPLASQSLIFDTNGNGKSYLNVLNNPNGNADHTINNNISANNALDVQNLVDQTLTLNGNINANANALTFETTGLTNVNGVISGSGVLTVEGNGTTVFAGNNTYTGTTTVQAGRLRIANNNALGNSGNDTIVQSGASLALSNNITTPTGEALTINGNGNASTGALTNSSGSNVFAGPVTLAGNSTIGSESGVLDVTSTVTGNGNSIALYAANGATTDLSGVVSGSGTSLNKTGTGTGILGGNNTYTGATTVSSGTLLIEHSNALGTTANGTTVASGATLEMTGGLDISGAESFNIAGTGVVGKAALWSSSGNNEINAPVTLSGGTTYIGAATGAQLLLDGSGGLNGAGQNVVITGGGTTVFKGPSGSQSGFTQVNNGATLLFGDAGNRINDNSAIIVQSGATLDMANAAYSDTVGSLAGGGTIRTRGATLTAGGDNTNTTFSGSIQDGGNFIKTGTGNMAFTGSNTFTGALSVNAGKATLGANNAFADNMDLTLGGGTFATNGFADRMDVMTLSSNSTIDFMGAAGGYLTFADMTRSGGTLTIDNWAGNFTGNGGTRLQVLDNNIGSFGSGPGALSNINFAGYGSAQMISLGGGVYEIVPSLADFHEWDGPNGQQWRNSRPNNWVDNDPPPDNSAGTKVLFADAVNGDRTVDLNGNRTVGTMVLASTGGKDYGFQSNNGNTRTLIFDQTGSSTAYLTVTGDGEHVIGNRNNRRVNVSLADNLLISNNSTGTTGLTFGVNGGTLSQFATNGNAVTITGMGRTVFNSQITGSGSLTKNGSGATQFNASSSYTGGTVLNDGTIEIGNNTALGTGAISFNGGRIGATGAARTLSPAYSINNGFTIGNIDSNNLTLSGAGNLTTNAALTVESGITGTLSGVISGNNQLTKEGAGTLSLTGANTFNNLVVNSGVVTSTVGGNMLVGGNGAGTSVFGDANVTVNAGGTLNATSGGSIEIGDGSTMSNTGGLATMLSGGNLTFDGNFNQTAGTTNFNVGGNILTDSGSSIVISGGTTNFTGSTNFTTAGSSSSILVSNGATANVQLSAGAAASTFNLTNGDALTVNGNGSNFNVATETAGSVNLNGDITLSNSGKMTVAQGPTVFGANSSFNGGSAATAGTLEVLGNLTFTAGMDIANAPKITLNVTSGNSVITAATANTNIENLGVITKTGDGQTTIGSNLNNLQATKIVINGGTLLNSTSNQIENNTKMEFGDNLSGISTPTWNLNDSNEVLGSLTLTNNSSVNIDLGSNPADGSIVKFADSASTTWSGTGSLVISGWNGSYGGGGTDQFFIGSTVNGVTNDQLSRIFFSNPPGLPTGLYTAQILSTGEIVPIPVPEPSTYFIGGVMISGLILFEWKRRQKLRIAHRA